VPLPQKKPPQQQQPKFDPTKIAQLIDKRDPQRHAAVGDVVNRTASLGAPGANAPQLSSSELDAMRRRLQMNWSPPAFGEIKKVEIEVQLTRDGRLASPPRVVSSGRGPMYEAYREAALRAVYASQPFDMLRPETYETWREVIIDFDENFIRNRAL
jgi:colicin import membrane protein